jgi:hypothetical protein
MFRRAASRLGTTVLVVLALLFSQLALASYICAGATGDEPAAMEMANGEPCARMVAQADESALCHQHCADAPQSFDGVKLPSPSLPAVVQVVVLPLALHVDARHTLATADGGLAPRPPEPVFLSTLRLRV